MDDDRVPVLHDYIVKMMNLKSDHQPRVSDFCGESFGSGRALGGHRRIHFMDGDSIGKLEKQNHGDRISYSCCLCFKAFSSEKSLQEHRNEHGSSSSSTVSEGTVGEVVPMPSWLRSIRKRKRSSGRKPDLRPVIGEDAAVHSLLSLASGEADEVNPTKKRGIEVDETEKEGLSCKRFKCGSCDKSFATFQALGGHRSSHNKSKQQQQKNIHWGAHKCKICDKSFPSGQALGGHQRRHWAGPNPVSHKTTATDRHVLVRSERSNKTLLFDLNELPPSQEEEADALVNRASFNSKLHRT